MMIPGINKMPLPKDAKKIMELSSLALVLPSSIAVGLLFGTLLDNLLGTHPWLLITFLLLGIASGFISLFRGINRMKDTENTEGASK